MRERFKKMWKEDKGGALALVGISLVLLISMAAFGTDLAWFYLNSSRVQRGADAAALGGVIWMPGDQPTAFSTAQDVAFRNGYDGSASDPDVIVTPANVAGEENQLQVTIRATIPTFFLKILGFDTVDVERTAIAEYIPPLKLGSPENQFGNSCDPEISSGCGGNFWANIHGKYTDTHFGDAYASFCANSNDNESCSGNPIGRSEGYLYGIESSNSFTVEFIDLAFHNLSGGENTGDDIRTGDRGCEQWGDSTAECGPTMIVNLYAPDPTPLDLSDNGAPVCTATVTPEPQVPESDPYVWDTPDGKGCWSQNGSGTWVVQVKHEDPGSTDNRAGLNRYSLRSTTGQLFALRDFSIYNNADGSTTAFYLAEVPDFYAGKTFVVELYDPGEFSGGGTAYLQVVGPDDQVWDDGVCRVYERNSTFVDWTLTATHNTGSDCQKSTTSNSYNGKWLKFEVDLPGDYTCDQAAGECWWKMQYDYPGSDPVQDTTTWRAYIIGNPIHLAS